MCGIVAIAFIKEKGLPHKPKPPARTVEPAGMSFTASAADGKTFEEEAYRREFAKRREAEDRSIGEMKEEGKLLGRRKENHTNRTKRHQKIDPKNILLGPIMSQSTFSPFLRFFFSLSLPFFLCLCL